MADDEVDITLTAEPPLDGSFPPLASTAPLNTFDDGDDDFSIPEKEALKLELSQTLGLTHTDRDLVSVDDTGMYNLVAQLSKKVIDLTEQVNNPPWFDKVMANVNRIDSMETKLDAVMEQVGSLNTRMAALVEAGFGESQAAVAGASVFEGEPVTSAETTTTPPTSEETPPSEEKSDSQTSSSQKDSTPNAMTSLQAITLAKDISDLGIQTQALRKEMKQRDENQKLEVESKFSELKMQNQRLHTRLQAEFPGIEEFKQFKQFSAERSKKLKLALQQRTFDMQRSIDEKFNTEIEKVFKWKDTFNDVTNNRMSSVEELVRSFSEDLTYLRGGVDEHVHMLEERIQENQQWCQKKFGESGAEMKKLMHRSHEIAAKQREHGEALDKDSKKFQQQQDLIEENREAAFNQSMELQLAIETLGEANCEQDMKFEKLSDNVTLLEAKSANHDKKFEANDAAHEKINETFKELQNMDQIINADVVKLREEELHETNTQVTQLLDSLDNKNQDVLGKIKNVLTFAESTKSSLVVTQDKLATIPGKIEEVKDDLRAVKKDVEDHQKETGEHSNLTDAILARLKDVENEATSIKFLKDKSVSMTDSFETMKKDFGQQIEDLSKNEALLSKLKEDGVVLERRLSTQIVTAKDDLTHKIETEVEVVKEQVKEIEAKTEEVVRDVIESGAMGKQRRQTRAQSDMTEHSGSHGHGRRNSNHGMGGGMSFGADISPGSVVGMTPDEVKEHESDVAEQVADALLEYEELCMSKTFLIEVPHDIRVQMTDLATQMAEFISSKADQEAIQKMIRGSQEDVTYTDEEIEGERVTLLFKWMRKVTEKIKETNPKPGKVRGEARDKVLKKMSDAIDMAMSKHDQVLITGHSRLGRVQLPTCIACDRPLAAKKRFRDMPEGAGNGQHVGVEEKMLKSKNFKEEAPQPRLNMMPAASRPETAGAYRTTSDYGMEQQQMVSMSRPGTSGGLDSSKRPIFGSSGSAAKFVYRGGFKMPKNGGKLQQGDGGLSIGLPSVNMR
ncbi:hypothetical protein TrLO_g14510 [Triparma laevis f. longispina]|uniref:Uncharacterized protein n=1 Tax=Triparma laevis f. longispina TaxID=1714387 RepID=A0A9W7AAC6_9STRA|nr:hypothetical protein TrLO_g14510 [Triparma laevis f. longispina]